MSSLYRGGLCTPLGISGYFPCRWESHCYKEAFCILEDWLCCETKVSRLPTPEYYYMHLGSGTPIAGAGVAIRGPIWNACPEAYAIFLQASLQPKTLQTPPAAAKRSTNACGSKGLDERSPVSPHRLPSLQVCAMRSTCCSLAPPIFLPIFPSGPLIDIRDILLADAV